MSYLKRYCEEVPMQLYAIDPERIPEEKLLAALQALEAEAGGKYPPDKPAWFRVPFTANAGCLQLIEQALKQKDELYEWVMSLPADLEEDAELEDGLTLKESLSARSYRLNELLWHGIATDPNQDRRPGSLWWELAMWDVEEDPRPVLEMIKKEGPRDWLQDYLAANMKVEDLAWPNGQAPCDFFCRCQFSQEELKLWAEREFRGCFEAEEGEEDDSRWCDEYCPCKS